MRRRICVLKGCDVVLDLLVDFLLGGAGEALALTFALRIRIPYCASPASIGALEDVPAGQ